MELLQTSILLLLAADVVHQYIPTHAFDNASGSYNFNQTVTRSSSTPSGLGADHLDRALSGYVGGIMYSTKEPLSRLSVLAVSPAFIVTNATGSPGDVSVTLIGNSSRMGAVFNVQGVAPTSPTSGTDPVFFADRFQTAQYRFGNTQPGTNTARSAYVDTSNFAARGETFFDATSGTNTPTSTVNGQATDERTGNTLMVVSDAVQANSTAFLSSISNTTVNPCVCEPCRDGTLLRF